MKLTFRNVPGTPQLSDFFWSCIGFFDPVNQCVKSESYRPDDSALLHKSGIVEMQLPGADLDIIASEAMTQRDINRRMSAHVQKTDDDVLCPIHSSPMILRTKKDADNLPTLDRYHLRCPLYTCKQTVKLKSFQQLASFLHRKEGTGILT